MRNMSGRSYHKGCAVPRAANQVEGLRGAAPPDLPDDVQSRHLEVHQKRISLF